MKKIVVNKLDNVSEIDEFLEKYIESRRNRQSENRTILNKKLN